MPKPRDWGAAAGRLSPVPVLAAALLLSACGNSTVDFTAERLSSARGGGIGAADEHYVVTTDRRVFYVDDETWAVLAPGHEYRAVLENGLTCHSTDYPCILQIVELK